MNFPDIYSLKKYKKKIKVLKTKKKYKFLEKNSKNRIKEENYQFNTFPNFESALFIEFRFYIVEF